MIGANMVRRLVAEGWHVAAMVRPQGSRARLRPIEQALEMIPTDLTDAAQVHAAVDRAQPQVVFHFASTIWTHTPATPAQHLATNALGTLHLLEALRDRPQTRLVFAGSSSVYGAGAQLTEESPCEPGSVYGATKAAASLLVATYARCYRLQTVELRLFMPYGPWESPKRLVPQTILSALAGRDIPMTQGIQQRDVVYMDDVIDALWRAATQPVEPGAIFNIGSGVAITVRELVERILMLMGRPVKPLIGALPMRADEIMEMSANISAAKAQLAWEPRTSLNEGLRRTIAWFTAHRDIVDQLLPSSTPPMREMAGAA